MTEISEIGHSQEFFFRKISYLSEAFVAVPGLAG
jgi:hypothetical protein